MSLRAQAAPEGCLNSLQAFHHILTTTPNPSTAKRVFLLFSERVVSIGALTGALPRPPLQFSE